MQSLFSDIIQIISYNIDKEWGYGVYSAEQATRAKRRAST